jgi:hypothetical protein
MPTVYAVFGLAPIRLLSRHARHGSAAAAFHNAAPPAALVRLDDDPAHGNYAITVVAAKGIAADALESNDVFRRAVRDAV